MKKKIYIALDTDVIEHARVSHKKYQTFINETLREAFFGERKDERNLVYELSQRIAKLETDLEYSKRHGACSACARKNEV